MLRVAFVVVHDLWARLAFMSDEFVLACVVFCWHDGFRIYLAFEVLMAFRGCTVSKFC